jgi:hypothetical protein
MERVEFSEIEKLAIPERVRSPEPAVMETSPSSTVIPVRTTSERLATMEELPVASLPAEKCAVLVFDQLLVDTFPFELLLQELSAQLPLAVVPLEAPAVFPSTSQ